MTQQECKYCERTIVLVNNEWIDPAADGDDNVWRSVCGSHNTFASNHGPKEAISACCNVAIQWIHCDECAGYDEPHDFATCSRCGADVGY